MKKLLTAAVVVLFALSAVSGAGEQEKSNKLVIGSMPNNLGAPTAYALEKGMFEEVGLEVELILFPTGAPINEALSAKKLDGSLTGLAGVYSLAAGECSYLGDYDLSLAGMDVYVRDDNPVLQHKGLIEGKPGVYGSAETIKGMTFLGPLGTSAQFNVVSWIQLFGLSTDDVNMLHMEFGPALNAFISGEGDALPTSPPFSYQAEEAGFLPVADMVEVTGMDMSNGFVFRTEVVEKRREDVQKFLNVIYEVIDIFVENDDIRAEFAYRFYNDNGRPHTMEMVWKEINERDFIGTAYAKRPEYRFGSTMIGMGSFYVSDGKIEKEDYPNIMNSMDTSFLENIIGKSVEIYEAPILID